MNTIDVIEYIEQEYEYELDAFFEQYLYSHKLPVFGISKYSPLRFDYISQDIDLNALMIKNEVNSFKTFQGVETFGMETVKLWHILNTHLSFLALNPCFGMYDKNWSSESHQIIFDTILEIFDSNRIMWGSNFPVEKLAHSYSYCIEQLLKWLKPLSKKDKSCITSETAANFYRI